MQRPATWPRSLYRLALAFLAERVPGAPVRFDEDGCLQAYRYEETDEGWSTLRVVVGFDDATWRLCVSSYDCQRDCDGKWTDWADYEVSARRKARRRYPFSTAYARTIGKRRGEAHYQRFAYHEERATSRDHSAESAGY